MSPPRPEPTIALAAVVCVKMSKGQEKAADVIRCARVDQIEIKGGDRRAMEDSRDASDYNELHPMFGETMKKCQEVR